MSKRNFARRSAKETQLKKLGDLFKLEFYVLFYFFEFFRRKPFSAHTVFHFAHAKQALRGNVGNTGPFENLRQQWQWSTVANMTGPKTWPTYFSLQKRLLSARLTVWKQNSKQSELFWSKWNLEQFFCRFGTTKDSESTSFKLRWSNASSKYSTNFILFCPFPKKIYALFFYETPDRPPEITRFPEPHTLSHVKLANLFFPKNKVIFDLWCLDFGLVIVAITIQY